MANEFVRGLGIKLEDFKHKLYVVSPGDLCSWGGMGYVGCTKDCRAWVSGDLWQVGQGSAYCPLKVSRVEGLGRPHLRGPCADML